MRSLRTMRTLIERQLAADGHCLVGMLSVTAVFLMALTVPSFIYPSASRVPVALFLLVLPIVMGLSLLVFGALQTRRDQDQRVADMLSVLAPQSQITLARLLVGGASTLVVVSVSVLTITGAVLSGLVGWPSPFFPGEPVNLFVTWLQVGLASYCLGLAVARNADTVALTLRACPLVLVFVSLIVVQGPGRRLAFVFLPLLGALLVYLFIPARREFCPYRFAFTDWKPVSR